MICDKHERASSLSRGLRSLLETLCQTGPSYFLLFDCQCKRWCILFDRSIQLIHSDIMYMLDLLSLKLKGALTDCTVVFKLLNNYTSMHLTYCLLFNLEHLKLAPDRMFCLILNREEMKLSALLNSNSK